MQKRILFIAGVILILFAISSPVFAMDKPDSVSVDNIEIFKDLLATDDFLAIVPYAIPFTTQPDNNINETFIFQIKSADGTVLYGRALATPAYTGGYGSGVVSFYFGSGMAWDTEYTLRVMENPAFYPSPKYWDFSIALSNYSDSADQPQALRDKIVESATYLSTVFSTALLTTSEAGATVLSTDGEIYYLAAIPGLQSMSPQLFGVQLENPDYTKRTWSYTLADALRTKYNGTFIYDFMTGYAGLFSMDTNSAMNFVSIILFAILIILSVWKFKASTLSAFIDGYSLLLLLMLMGFFSMILAGFMAFCSVVLGGVVLFLNRA